MSDTCHCDSCCETVNPFVSVGQAAFAAINAFVEKINGSSSSSSSIDIDIDCISNEDFFQFLTGLVPLFGDEATKDNTTLVTSVFSPIAQAGLAYTAEALNDYCTGSRIEGYSAAQLNFIEIVLNNIPRVPTENLICLLSKAEGAIAQSRLSTSEKEDLYITTAVTKGITEALKELAKEPGNLVPFVPVDEASRWRNVRFHASAAFFGANSVSAKSYKTRPVSTVINIGTAILGGLTLTGATLVLRNVPGPDVR